MNICCADKLYPETALGASRLTAIALAHALSFFAAVASSLNVSGGHINPAVTFGALVGGRISVVRAVYYWLAQLVGAVVASLLLRLATDGLVHSSLCCFNIFTLVFYLRLRRNYIVVDAATTGILSGSRSWQLECTCDGDSYDVRTSLHSVCNCH